MKRLKSFPTFVGYNLDTKFFEVCIHVKFATFEDVKGFADWLLQEAADMKKEPLNNGSH